MGKCIYSVIQFTGFLLQILPVVFLIYVPYDNRQLKISKKKITWIMAGIAIVVFAVTSFFMGMFLSAENRGLLVAGANLIFALYWGFGTAVYFLNQKKGNPGRLLSYMIAIQYAVIAYTIAELGTKITGEFFKFSILVPYSLDGIAFYVIFTLLTYPFVYYYLKKYSFYKLKRISRKNIYVISACSLVLFIIYIAAILVQMQMGIEGVDKVYRFVWILSLILTDILAYVIFFVCLNIEDRNSEIQVQLAAAELQYKSLCERIEEEKRMEHNMRHHFRSLVSLMEDKKYGELEQYLRSYLNEWELLGGKKISRNPVINHVLEYYFKEAEAKGIHVEKEIEVKEYYPFSISDMTVLLGNLMENALEACDRCEEREPFLRIMIKQYKKSILIEESNDCLYFEPEQQGRGRAKSSKQGRAEGYGIASIRMIAEKYRGSVEFWSAEGTFTIRIVMNIPDNRQKETEGEFFYREKV